MARHLNPTAYKQPHKRITHSSIHGQLNRMTQQINQTTKSVARLLPPRRARPELHAKLERAARRQVLVQDAGQALRAGVGALWVVLPRRRRHRIAHGPTCGPTTGSRRWAQRWDLSRDGRRDGWTRRTGTASGLHAGRSTSRLRCIRSGTGSESNIVRQAFWRRREESSQCREQRKEE